MPRRSSVPGTTEQARFVFKGTVRRLKASTVRDVPASARTAVVRVDDIVYAPEALSDQLGHDITVLSTGRKPLQVGQQAIFYVNSGIFGESVAVVSLDHRAAEGVPAAMTAAAVGVSPARQLANRDALARFQQADVVVSGTVVSVSLPAGAARAGTARASARAAVAVTPAGTTSTAPVSEHDPVIHDAEIEVAAVHKGRHTSSKVKVRFPASTDVKWYRAPKFHVGQEGFFMLHKDEAATAARPAVRAAAVAVATDVSKAGFTALHPADVQPFDDPGGIRSLITQTPPIQ